MGLPEAPALGLIAGSSNGATMAWKARRAYSAPPRIKLTRPGSPVLPLLSQGLSFGSLSFLAKMVWDCQHPPRCLSIVSFSALALHAPLVYTAIGSAGAWRWTTSKVTWAFAILMASRPPRQTRVQGGLSTVEFNDKTLKCQDCGVSFVFTAGEQQFFHEKGLMNEPLRCPACRASRRRGREGGGPRIAHPVTCAACGAATTVPFVPRNNRPVYCSSCYDRVLGKA